MTQDGRDYPGGPLVVSDDLAVTDIGCDLDGYPVRATAGGGRNDHLVQSCVQLAPQHWDDLNKYVPSPSARIAALEAENTHLRALLNRVTPERLSAGWEHLPDVAAPPVRTMPARALRGGDGVPR